MHVPMNDLTIQYSQLKVEIDAAIAEVIENCSFILGPQVEAFEHAYADYTGASYCIGVSNGTDALKLALRAADIGEGDEVITTSLTFGATVEAICDVGAKPVFVDVDPRYLTIDIDRLTDKITSRTRAVIPVHLYGQMADMDPIIELAHKHGFVVIEDAAQAQGARYKDRLAGSIGHMGCFSFYPGKNLGAYGDAGAIITSDSGLDEKLRSLRNHGQKKSPKFWYESVGYNNRMDGIQGGVLKVKLPHLDAWNKKRREIAGLYREGLKDLQALKLPDEAAYAYHVYHLYAIRLSNRDTLAAALKDVGVSTAVQYPFPVHATDAYKSPGCPKGALPVCEKACTEILSLPLFPDLTGEQVEFVIDEVVKFLD